MQGRLSESDINESIRYASYIQAAMLPDMKEFNKILPESFIFYKPRDIVSGDFYWVLKKKNRIAIAAADCTGHGVPGAFMSIMGINYLNLIASNSIPVTNKILNTLREYLMKAMHQEGDVNEQKDGIDMAICVIDLERNHLEYSGANNPLIYFNKGKINLIRGDRMPIGISPVEEESFKKHIIPFSEIDSFYIFSDGYPDQFGGPDNKKLKNAGFRELLKKINKISFAKQEKVLGKELGLWMGEEQQTDDILIIGIDLSSFK